MEVDDDSERWRRRRKGEKVGIKSEEVEEEEKEKTWSKKEKEKEKEVIWSDYEEEKGETWDRDKVMVKIEDEKKEKENDGALNEKLVTSKNIATGMTVRHGIISPSSLPTPQCSPSPLPQTSYTSKGHCADRMEFSFSALTPPVTRLAPSENEDDVDWDKNKDTKESSADSWAWRATHAPHDELESVAVRVRVMRCFEDTQYVAVEWLAEHYWRKYHRVLCHENYVGYKLVRAYLMLLRLSFCFARI